MINEYIDTILNDADYRKKIVNRIATFAIDESEQENNEHEILCFAERTVRSTLEMHCNNNELIEKAMLKIMPEMTCAIKEKRRVEFIAQRVFMNTLYGMCYEDQLGESEK